MSFDPCPGCGCSRAEKHRPYCEFGSTAPPDQPTPDSPQGEGRQTVEPRFNNLHRWGGDECNTCGSRDPANRLVTATCQDSFHTVGGTECDGYGRIDGISPTGVTSSRICRGCAACAATRADSLRTQLEQLEKAVERAVSILFRRWESDEPKGQGVEAEQRCFDAEQLLRSALSTPQGEGHLRFSERQMLRDAEEGKRTHPNQVGAVLERLRRERGFADQLVGAVERAKTCLARADEHEFKGTNAEGGDAHALVRQARAALSTTENPEEQDA